MSQEFTLKIINETRNYFLEETEQNELIIRTHRKVCATVNYIEYFLSFYNYWMYFNFCFCFFDWYLQVLQWD